SAAKLRSGPYEVAGIVPVGPAYVFTRDRQPGDCRPGSRQQHNEQQRQQHAHDHQVCPPYKT
ncbi:MAG: hypothetical protein ACLGHG_05065, partial [Gammaproteobacteria bacterium]